MKNLVTEYFQLKTRRALIGSFFIINAILITSMVILEQNLKPITIVEFELAGSIEKAQTMLQVWEARGVMPVVFFLLGIDYLFMIVYSFSLWFACLHVADAIRFLEKFVVLVAWLLPVAAVLDAVENAALFQFALGSRDLAWPAIARHCAVPKFVIALTALALWVVCGCAKMFKKKEALH